jgi:hypothetical protein
MEGLTIVNTDDKLVLTINKNNFTEEVLSDVYKIARMYYLICKADFDESVLEIGEEIKREWWENNKARFLQPDK